MPSPLSHISNIFIRVSDLEKSIDWYTKTLGFRNNWLHHEGGYASIDYEGFPVILIKKESMDETKQSDFSLLNFHTANIEEAHKYFNSQGVNTGEVETLDNAKWFWFKDPDDNIFQVSYFE